MRQSVYSIPRADSLASICFSKSLYDIGLGLPCPSYFIVSLKLGRAFVVVSPSHTGVQRGVLERNPLRGSYSAWTLSSHVQCSSSTNTSSSSHLSSHIPIPWTVYFNQILD
ncbi:hypothetical protein MHBO_003277 [Bonamia ostreae]|uniref:Uncharacterized protein n=1 Tax=Bonamia ostreae TaxID=126728 RepID=A0ABV2APZ1_9EUKA